MTDPCPVGLPEILTMDHVMVLMHVCRRRPKIPKAFPERVASETSVSFYAKVASTKWSLG